jgi:UDP-glucose 4-epimerase
MKITVIGGGGFLGSHLSDTLSKKGYKVTIFDKKKSKWLKKNQRMIIGNILNSKLLDKTIKGSQIVYNFAAISDIGYAKYKPIETAEINIVGTLNALRASKKYKIKKFIQASSIYATSEEGGFYARSKKAAEDYIEEFKKVFGLNYTILRFGSLYGERTDKSNAINNMIHNALKRKKLIYPGMKNAARRYIHVRDAAKACAKVIDKKYNNKYITITGNKSVKIKKIFKILTTVFKIPKKKMFFLNKKYTGHYNVKPTIFKQRTGKILSIRNQKEFKTSLLKLATDANTLKGKRI